MVSVKSNNIAHKAIYHTNSIKIHYEKDIKIAKWPKPLHVGTWSYLITSIIIWHHFWKLYFEQLELNYWNNIVIQYSINLVRRKKYWYPYRCNYSISCFIYNDDRLTYFSFFSTLLHLRLYSAQHPSSLIPLYCNVFLPLLANYICFMACKSNN